MAYHPDLDEDNDDLAHIERCRRDFEATGNPLYAWEAWGTFSLRRRSTIEESIELPDWLVAYFDECEKRLLGIPMVEVSREPLIDVGGSGIHFKVDTVVSRPCHEAPDGEGPGSIGRALDFDSSLARSRAGWGGPYNTNEALADRLVEIMWQESWSLERAARQAEENRWASTRKAKEAVRNSSLWAKRKMLTRLEEEEVGEFDRLRVSLAYSKLCRSRAKQSA